MKNIQHNKSEFTKLTFCKQTSSCILDPSFDLKTDSITSHTHFRISRFQICSCQNYKIKCLYFLSNVKIYGFIYILYLFAFLSINIFQIIRCKLMVHLQHIFLYIFSDSGILCKNIAFFISRS